MLFADEPLHKQTQCGHQKLACIPKYFGFSPTSTGWPWIRTGGRGGDLLQQSMSIYFVLETCISKNDREKH